MHFARNDAKEDPVAPTTSDRRTLLEELHAGLRTRRAPQDVAHILCDLGVDATLTATARTALRVLACQSARRDPDAAMPDTFRRHPGLDRAYQAASTLMDQVTQTAGVPRPAGADPSDPASLGAWLTAAHQVLGVDPATARPARATVSNREHTITRAYRTFPEDDWAYSNDPTFNLKVTFQGAEIPLEDIDFGPILLEQSSWDAPQVNNSDPAPAPSSESGTGDDPEPAPAASEGTVETFTYVHQRRPRGRRGDKGGHGDARVRYDATARRTNLPGVSVRTYRKAVRAVLHLAQRTAVLAGERDREAAIAYGKTRLAYTVDLEDFTASEPVAAFVAYYTARLGMRTLFTSGAQVRPMDTLAEELLGQALASPDCRHDVIARVLTRRQVLQHLDDQAKGELFGLTHAHLVTAARTLQGAWDPNRRDMIVRPGDDSTSWNTASRAFNQARTGVLNLAGELGLTLMLEQSCPGKVPALIAADVARWHEIEGGGHEHQDTAVFNELPKPWDVVLGDAPCTLELVREVAIKHVLDPDTTGWTAAYRQSGLETPAPAPALVHGCVVTSPEIARQMRRAGWYSGQM